MRGGANPCRLAMASWNYGAVANKAFIAANLAIKSLIEQIKFLPSFRQARPTGTDAASSRVFPASSKIFNGSGESSRV